MTERTSLQIASIAARGLTDPASLTPDEIQSVCGSALTQRELPEGTILVPMQVDYEKVANAFTGAIEGGSSYWCRDFISSKDDVSATLRREIREAGGVWYAEARYWQEGGQADLAFDDPEKGEGNGEGVLTIGKAEIILGLGLMAEKASQHFSDLINENDDATTHDVFLQFVVLREIVYG